MTHSRREENLDEGNNNGLEKVVKYLEKIYTKKDHPGNSPSLEVSLRYCKLLNKPEKRLYVCLIKSSVNFVCYW